MTVNPSKLGKRITKSGDLCPPLRVSFLIIVEYANALNLLALLRARGARPYERTSRKRNEFAPFHSITSSAATCKVSGTLRPSVFAALRLMTNSNLADWTTGSSAGFTPFKILPT